MALRPLSSIQNAPPCSTTITCCLKTTFQSKPRKDLRSDTSRRIGTIAGMASVVLVKEAIFSQDNANGLEFRSATPDERSDGRSRKWNQRALLQIKDFLASESWKEARQVLRRCSSNLKLDLYAVIQSKPGKERSQLRTLFQSLEQCN